MNDLLSLLDLAQLISDAGLPIPSDFEGFYSDLAARGTHLDLQLALEERIHAYFAALELPVEASLYDYLILGCRSKDVIATFNWDPFLWQAAERSAHIVSPPRLIFLHGNVLVGYCHRDRRKGNIYRSCDVCGEAYEPSRLLYPVKRKDYNSDLAIRSEWSGLRNALSNAFLLTIFGYGAPATDVEAVDLMKQGWTARGLRELEETELIDIRPEDELRASWADFIFSHHYRVTCSLTESLVCRFPRRTCEAMRAQLMDAQFLDDNWFPNTTELSELHDWIGHLTQHEPRA